MSPARRTRALSRSPTAVPLPDPLAGLSVADRDLLAEGGVLLTSVPLPPSENEIYRNVAGVGRVRSSTARAYAEAFNVWALTHASQLRAARALAALAPTLSVSVYLGFRTERLFTKAGGLKRCDTANYLKLLLDCLCEAIGVDDKCFFSVNATKYPMPAEKAEIATLELRVMRVPSLRDVQIAVGSSALW